MENIAILIQARLGSTRLPNKVLMPFDGEVSILEIIVQNLINSGLKDKVVIVTSDNALDDRIVEFANEIGVKSYRGSEQNVLSRFVDAANEFEVDGIVRVCADNPLLDIDSIKYLIDNANDDLDYLSFKMSNGRPTILNHIGLFSEYVSKRALDKAASLTEDPLYLEHVTNFIYGNPDQFNVQLDNAPEAVYNRPGIRLTCDSIDDFEMLQAIYSELKLIKNSDIVGLIELVDNNEQWQLVMKEQIDKYEK